jgi:hypothetical protein
VVSVRLVSRLVSGALTIAVLVLASPARAQSTGASAAPEEDALVAARRTFAEGVAAQEAGKHREALVLYTRVRETVVSPTLLFNIAACHDALGELIRAKQTYELAVAEAKTKADPEVDQAARMRVQGLEVEIPQITVRLAPRVEAPEATLDGAPIAIEALASLRVDPGAHRLSIRSERHVRVFELAFELPRGANRLVDVDLGPPGSAAETSTSPPGASSGSIHERTYTPAFLAGGVALSLTAASVVTGVLGHDRRGRYESLNEHPSAANRDEREELRSSGTDLYTANAILGGAALLAAGVAVYFVVRPPKVAAPRAGSAGLVVGPGSIGAGGRF